jgi:hypothetical protein
LAGAAESEVGQQQTMLVIVGARRLDNDRIEIAVTRPQHDSNGMLEYRSEKEIREVLSNLGIYTENDRFSLESANTMGLNEHLKFPPMDVPKHSLRLLGFRL